MRALDDTRLNQTLLALADPTRRAILRQLASGAARITDLAAPFDVSLNAVSKHIKLLERAGLVRRQVIGRVHRIATTRHRSTRLRPGSRRSGPSGTAAWTTSNCC
jgi:DNA-binding transcriptional ArsR family regulator